MLLKCIKVNEFLKILVENWQYFSTGILAVLSFILMLIKRKPKKYDEFVSCVSQTLSAVPGFINAAEEFEEDPQDRKSSVIGWCFQKMENLIKRELTKDEELYCYKTFSWFIENVLSTPQKAESRKEED